MVPPGGRHVVMMVLCRVGCVRQVDPVCAGQARCADAVRGCPCGRRLGACGHGHMADSVVKANITRLCLRRSDGM